jgi:hypothetical protein
MMRLSIRTLLRARPGRRRAQNVARGADGASDGERPEDIVRVAKSQRMRAGAAAEDALNHLHATTLGTLFRRWQLDHGDPSGVSEPQYLAAQRYLGYVVANARLLGIPAPHPRSAALLLAGAGLSCEREPDAAWTANVRGRFRDCRRVLLDCGAGLGVGARVNAAVYAVVVEDRRLGDLGRADIENLRCGLNALARYFG